MGSPALCQLSARRNPPRSPFCNLRVLFRPKLTPAVRNRSSCEANVSSIVLVHGLNVWSNPTHADDTWTSESPEGKVHWVRDFLPLHEETFRARALVHTYNASTIYARTGVVAQAENLLGWLWQERQVSCTTSFYFSGLVIGQSARALHRDPLFSLHTGFRLTTVVQLMHKIASN